MRPIAMHTLFLLFVALFLFNPIATNAEAPVGPPKEVPNKTDSGIYQYTGKDGVTVFTNNIDAVPLSQRRRTGVPVVT
ncbi:MAG: hypothetical protein HY037_02730 [Nitrospirae bacterium]|nr:hypothetical protein [Candidatus Troglogloeales bacterium]